ncbi:MAG: hypothetical protein WD794_09840 [Mycobacteriales bacterium]
MISTLPAPREPAEVRRSRGQRRIGLVVLTAFVLAGAVGLLGTHTSTTTVRGGGYELTVTYPRISRPGHAVRVQVEVRRAGGFGGEPVQLRYRTEWLEMFDENAFTPAPNAETAGPGYTEDEFLPPRGEVFVMTVDTRIEPARQRGEHGFFSVVDQDGTPAVTAEVATWIWP